MTGDSVSVASSASSAVTCSTNKRHHIIKVFLLGIVKRGGGGMGGKVKPILKVILRKFCLRLTNPLYCIFGV